METEPSGCSYQELRPSRFLFPVGPRSSEDHLGSFVVAPIQIWGVGHPKPHFGGKISCLSAGEKKCLATQHTTFRGHSHLQGFKNASLFSSDALSVCDMRNLFPSRHPLPACLPACRELHLPLRSLFPLCGVLKLASPNMFPH